MLTNMFNFMLYFDGISLVIFNFFMFCDIYFLVNEITANFKLSLQRNFREIFLLISDPNLPKKSGKKMPLFSDPSYNSQNRDKGHCNVP